MKSNVEFLDKIENRTKIITIEHENVIGKVNKKMQSSKGMIKFIRSLELTIRIQGRVYKIIVDAFLIVVMFHYYGRNITQKSNMIDIVNVINIVAKVTFFSMNDFNLWQRI